MESVALSQLWLLDVSVNSVLGCFITAVAVGWQATLTCNLMFGSRLWRNLSTNVTFASDRSSHGMAGINICVLRIDFNMDVKYRSQSMKTFGNGSVNTNVSATTGLAHSRLFLLVGRRQFRSANDEGLGSRRTLVSWPGDACWRLVLPIAKWTTVGSRCSPVVTPGRRASRCGRSPKVRGRLSVQDHQGPRRRLMRLKSFRLAGYLRRLRCPVP